MIAVIVLPWISSKIYGLNTGESLVLLPIGDRSGLQHIVESLISQGITSIEIILSQTPERIEALLGNGDKWGCKISYHLIANPNQPYRPLKFIQSIESQPWILVHGDCYPWIDFATDVGAEPLFYLSDHESYLEMDEIYTSQVNDHVYSKIWKGAAIFPAGRKEDKFSNQTAKEMKDSLKQLALDCNATIVPVSLWLDISTPEALLETQTKLLNKEFYRATISGIQRDVGVHISNNVVIHPTVELIPPIYLGPNSRLNQGVRLGPNVVLSGNCIVDANTKIQHSLIATETYIGESLELNQVIANHDILMNVRLGTSVSIKDSFLIGNLVQQNHESSFVIFLRSIFALLLIAFLWPLMMFSIIYFSLKKGLLYTTIPTAHLPMYKHEGNLKNYRLLCLGKNAWSVHRPAGWDALFRQLLPGLFSVASGQLCFVGLPPKSSTELRSLSKEWLDLYLRNKVGLITESSISVSSTDETVQLYMADAFYIAKHNLWYDFKLALRYCSKLLVFIPKN